MMSLKLWRDVAAESGIRVNLCLAPFGFCLTDVLMYFSAQV